MIKKISQLDRLPLDAIVELSGDKVLFEVSYKTNDDNLNATNADEINYYTSYSINKSGLETIIGIDAIREILSSLIEGGISTITGDLSIGMPGIGQNDRLLGHKFYPDIDHNLKVYSNVDFEGNRNKIHGQTEFHNNVVISCNSDKDDTSKPILHVGGIATFDQTINGTAFRARWADLAEVYESDRKYPPGTIVEFGGEKEITIATTKANAVVTSLPAIVMNDKDKTEKMDFPLEIAMVGKVPIRIIGPVKKFDNIVLSKTNPGIGVSYNFSLPYEIIGKALEDNPNSGEKLVFCVTNLSLR